MRRLLAVLALIAILASACGSSETVEVNAGKATTTTTTELLPEPAAAAEEAIAEPDEVVAEASTTTTEAAPEPLRTGREAILANHTEGKPYVLWYWGAH